MVTPARQSVQRLFFALSTGAGNWAMISNANPRVGRRQLFLSTSEDGRVFTCMALLAIPSARPATLQYPHAIEREGHLLAALSCNKATIEVLRDPAVGPGPAEGEMTPHQIAVDHLLDRRVVHFRLQRRCFAKNSTISWSGFAPSSRCRTTHSMPSASVSPRGAVRNSRGGCPGRVERRRAAARAPRCRRRRPAGRPW